MLHQQLYRSRRHSVHMPHSETEPFLRRIASYMHNAGRDDGLSDRTTAGGYPKLFDTPAYALCTLCTAPIESRFQTCWPCRQAPTEAIPDVAAFLSYALNDLQSGNVAHRYKDAYNTLDGDPKSQHDMAVLLYLCMAKHSQCIWRTHAYERLGVTTVPSGSGRREHPLERKLFTYVQGPPVIDVRRTAPARPRGQHEIGVDPTRYEIRSDVTDTHVLVLDDTWTTGAQTMSVVSALRRAGAARVTTLCVMRYMQRDYPTSAGWLQEQGTLPMYSDDFCPVTRSFTCPR